MSKRGSLIDAVGTAFFAGLALPIAVGPTVLDSLSPTYTDGLAMGVWLAFLAWCAVAAYRGVSDDGGNDDVENRTTEDRL